MFCDVISTIFFRYRQMKLSCVPVPLAVRLAFTVSKTALGSANKPHSSLGAEKHRGWRWCKMRTVVRASIATS